MPDNIFDNIISDIQNKNFHSAIQHLDNLIDKEPGNHALYEIKAGCNYALGNFDEAIDDWTYAIINFRETSDHKKELAVLYNKRGKANLKSGNYISASEDFNKSLKLFPESAETYNNLSTALRRLKNFNEALIYANKSLSIDPLSSDAFNNRGNIYYCLGNTDDALKDYTSAVELDPNNAKAFFNRGSLYYQIHEIDKARKDWETAISLDAHIKHEIDELHPGFFEPIIDLPESKEKNPEINERENTISQNINDNVDSSSVVVDSSENDIDNLSEREIKESLDGSVEKSELEESEKFIRDSEIENSEEKLLQESDELTPSSDNSIDENIDVTFHKETFPFTEDLQSDSGSSSNQDSQEETIESFDDIFAGLQANQDIEIEHSDTEIISDESPLTLEKLREEFTTSSSLDIPETPQTESESNVSEKSVTSQDIEIPDLDFKSIFQNNQGESDPEIQPEEPEQTKPLISEDALLLHKEIENTETNELNGFKGFTMKEDVNLESRPAGYEMNLNNEIGKDKGRKITELITSPAFLAVIILGLMFVAIFVIYKLLGINPQQNADVIQPKEDSTLKVSGITSDTSLKTKDTSISGIDEDAKQNQETEKNKSSLNEETSQKDSIGSSESSRQIENVTSQNEPQYKGFISDKQNFILFLENDGYYVQAGSYKDESKADEIVKNFSKKGVKAFISRVDLKDKGVFFRIKAGPFKTEEESKKIMTTFE